MPEVTGPQVIAAQETVRGKRPATYKKIRRIRKDPTVALARKLFYAGIIVSQWQYKGIDDSVPQDRIDFIKSVFDPMRRHILARTSLGCLDYGWQPFEKVIDIINGSAVFTKFKPLIQDETEIQEDEDTGAFLGFKQGETEIPLQNSMLFNWDVEGTEYKGESTIALAEGPFDSTLVLEDAAQRFDKKMAGAHWVIVYPDGVSNFNGVDTPNHIIADNLLKTLQASGHIAIPGISDLARDLGTEVNGQDGGWQIKLIAASGSQFPFGDRFAYLDKLKVRALGFPERAILEGQFGTKAESEAQADFVIVLIEDRHMSITEQLNWHAVNQLLRLNYGPEAENTVQIVPSPLTDEKKAMLKALYDTILNSPDGFIREIDHIDVQGIAEQLGVPRNEVTEPTLPTLPEPSPGVGTTDPTNLGATQPAPAPDPTAVNAAATALNGAQTQSLVDLALKVGTGELTSDVAMNIARVAFPNASDASLKAIFACIVVKQPSGTQPTPALPTA